MYQLASARERCDNVVRGYGETAICRSFGEDYADSSWPVVVKVQPGVSKDQLVRWLQDLSQAVDKGFFKELTEERAAKLKPLLDDPRYSGQFATPSF